MRELTVAEYRTIGPLSLAPAEVVGLRAHDKKLVVTADDNPGHYSITATSWVGVIAIPTLQLRIQPKIPIDRLLFLIGYTCDPDAWRAQTATYEKDALLLEAVIHGFVAAVRSATALGLLQGYRATEEALVTMRGRVRFADQIRTRYGRMPPVEVAYDEFTDDIVENRLVRATLHRLSRLPIRSQSCRHGLRSVGSMFHGITLVDYSNSLPTVQYNRLNRHYRTAVELARLILKSTSLRETSGSLASSAFLLDMNRLFEDFLAIALRESLRHDPIDFVRHGQGRAAWLDAAQTARLEPDISLWIGSRCVFAGDAKYKQAGDRPFNADVYQALAYAIGLDLRSVTLLYAGGTDASFAVVNTDKMIFTRGIDLTIEPDLLIRRIHEFANDIRAAISEGSRNRTCNP